MSWCNSHTSKHQIAQSYFAPTLKPKPTLDMFKALRWMFLLHAADLTPSDYHLSRSVSHKLSEQHSKTLKLGFPIMREGITNWMKNGQNVYLAMAYTINHVGTPYVQKPMCQYHTHYMGTHRTYANLTRNCQCTTPVVNVDNYVNSQLGWRLFADITSGLGSDTDKSRPHLDFSVTGSGLTLCISHARDQLYIV